MIGFGISTRDRKDQLLKCLDAVWRFAPPECPIVVSDDGSKDGTVQAIDLWSMENDVQNVTVASRQEHRGVAATKRVLTEFLLAAKGVDEIILIEDDVVPLKRNWYARFQETAELNVQAHLLYLPTNWKYGRTIAETGPLTARIQWKIYCGALVMYFRSELLREVGGFDEKFGMYGWEHNLLTSQCLVAQGQSPDKFPHCLQAENDVCLLAQDVLRQKLPYHENAKDAKLKSAKMQTAQANKGVYDGRMRTVREKFAAMTDAGALKYRSRFFPLAKEEAAR